MVQRMVRAMNDILQESKKESKGTKSCKVAKSTVQVQESKKESKDTSAFSVRYLSTTMPRI